MPKKAENLVAVKEQNFFHTWNLNKSFTGLTKQASGAFKNVISSSKFEFKNGLLNGTDNLLRCYYEVTENRAMIFFRFQHTQSDEFINSGMILRVKFVDVSCSVENGEIICVNPNSYFSPKGTQLQKFMSQLLNKEGPDTSPSGDSKWHFWVLYAKTIPFTKEDNRSNCSFFLNDFSCFTFQITMELLNKNPVSKGLSQLKNVPSPTKTPAPLTNKVKPAKKNKVPSIFKVDPPKVKTKVQGPLVNNTVLNKKYIPIYSDIPTNKKNDLQVSTKIDKKSENRNIILESKLNYFANRANADRLFGQREFPEAFEMTKFRRAIKKRSKRLSTWKGKEIVNPSLKKINKWKMLENFKTKIPFTGKWKWETESALGRGRSIEWINTLEGLQIVRNACTKAGVFAFDIEASDRDCIIGHTTTIQISTPTSDFIIDTLEVFAQIKSTLGPVFQNGNILKLAFSIGNEIRYLIRDFDIYVVGGVDVQGMCRTIFQGENPKLGLVDIASRVLNEDLDKEFQAADFRLRPLPIPLQMYALNDSTILIPLYNKLMEHWRTIATEATILAALKANHKLECERKVKFEIKGPKPRLDITKVDETRRAIELILYQICLKYDLNIEVLLPTEMIELLMIFRKKKVFNQMVYNRYHVLIERFVELRNLFLNYSPPR